MKKVIKIEITENDNLLTAYAKGMTEGAINSAVVCLGIAGVVYALGKAVKANEEKIEKETEELEGDL